MTVYKVGSLFYKCVYCLFKINIKNKQKPYEKYVLLHCQNLAWYLE